MKSLEQIKAYKSQTLDNRDIIRLVNFMPEEYLNDMGIELKDEYKGKHVPKELTRENILEQLKEDVLFGYEKAINQRGISSYLMYEVVRMWNWILEEGLEDLTSNSDYEIDYFKIVAEKYNISLKHIGQI